MFPDLFSIGPFTLHTYGVFVAAGFFVGVMVAVKIGKAEGINSRQVTDFCFFLLIGAVAGSRIMYVLVDPGYFLRRPLEIFKIWQGGLVFSGGLVAVLIVALWYAGRHRLSVWKLGDTCAPAAAIGQTIGRIGCFMAGCCYGKPTDLPWAVVFTDPQSLAPLNVPLHPTQLYHALGALVIFVILMLLHSRKQFDGQLLLWFLILHSAARLTVERFRGDNRGVVPGTDMSVTQLLTVIVLVGSIIVLFVVKSRRRKQQTIR